MNWSDQQRAQLLQIYKDKITQLGDEEFFSRFDEIREEAYKTIGVSPDKPTPLHDRPMTVKGLISYRYKGQYGWIMIGAHNHVDALQEAGRSTDDQITIANLQVWNEEKSCYVELTNLDYIDPIHTVRSAGRLGGLSKSEAKVKAVRDNGKKGGRPKSSGINSNLKTDLFK